ncbi:MAG: flagellar hook assembly protein FlgD [Hyphomicrobium sp.]
MQVTATTPTTTAQSQAAAATKEAEKTGTLDYSAFLQLLIAQLKNQDPTKPMDSAQYIGQLASFSNVEQSVKLNTKLDTLITSQALTQADSLIGRVVTTSDGSVSGKVTGLRILDGSAVAILENGTELDIGAGLTVSAS